LLLVAHKLRQRLVVEDKTVVAASAVEIEPVAGIDLVVDNQALHIAAVVAFHIAVVEGNRELRIVAEVDNRALAVAVDILAYLAAVAGNPAFPVGEDNPDMAYLDLAFADFHTEVDFRKVADLETEKSKFFIFHIKFT
jgi:hypothetical protein